MFTWVQRASGRALGRKNPSIYLKYLTNYTMLGFPMNPLHRLDTRATEIVSLAGPLRRG